MTSQVPSPATLCRYGLTCRYGPNYEDISPHDKAVILYALSLAIAEIKQGRDARESLDGFWEGFFEDTPGTFPAGFGFKELTGRSLETVIYDQHRIISAQIHTQ
ncbi:MAG: hypothetical protein ACFCA4_18780 [Cyanophyceae cyanobacterium]